MRNSIKIIVLIAICLLISGCDLFKTNPKVTFNYNCDGIDDYNCQVLDNKLNCIFIMPECGTKTFAGWYDAKTSGNEVNLDADFNESVVIYAQWKEDQKSTNTPSPKPTIVEPVKPKPTNPNVVEPIDSTANVQIEESVKNIKYKVSFNPNGGSKGQSKAVEVKYNEIMPSISKTKPVRSGYTFMGWFDNSDYTKGDAYYNEHCEATRYYDRNTTLMLYAGWKEIPSSDDVIVDPEPEPEPEPVSPPANETIYLVTFNANNGTGGQSESLKAEYNKDMPKINSSKPTRTGYTFMGWYDNKDYTKGKKYYTDSQASAIKYDRKNDITLYAGWKINNYKVSFNSNGGSGGQSETLEVKYNEAMPKINSSKPIRTGYTFMGWYDNSDYTKGKKYYTDSQAGATVYDKNSDTTLYAGWKTNKYTITFNSNGGSGGQNESLTVEYNAMVPSINKTIPIRNEYTFTGWYDNSDYTKGKAYYNDKNEPTSYFDKTSNLTLYAGWSKIIVVQNYKVTFDINGGSGTTPNTVTATVGNNMPTITSTIPTRSGYTFMGWYDNANYTNGTQYYTNANTSARKYDKKSDTTLYAGWKINEVQTHTLAIIYNGNGGTWNNPKQNIYDVDSSGNVIVKSTGKIYSQNLKYGTSLSENGFVDYNGSYINFTKEGYSVPLNKEYIISGTNTILSQSKSYSASTLANYVNCDLSKKDCTITIKVNFVLPITISGKQYKKRYSNVSGFKGYVQNFAISNFNKSSETLYISSSERGHAPSNTTDSTIIESLNTAIINKFETSPNGSGRKATIKEKMYLKNSGHGQPFDYDIKNDVFITNDYKTTVTYGTTTYGSSTGLMGIKFKKVDKGGSYSKVFSYNLNIGEPMPIIDNENSVFGRVKGRDVYLYDYDYNSLLKGTFDFSKPKLKFTITRADPSGNSIPSQGFALFNGFLYEVSGGYGKDAYLEAFNMKGKSIYKVKLGNGYSTANSREIEGVKVYNNNIYIASTFENNGTKVDIGYYE